MEKLHKIALTLIFAALFGGCSPLVNQPASYEADGMYAPHDREEITKAKEARANIKYEYSYEYESLSNMLYRYDWWGYRPMYGSSRYLLDRHSRYRYSWGHNLYIYHHLSPYWFEWGDPYSPLYPYFNSIYFSPFWYSSWYYYDWFYFGHSHRFPPAAGSSAKRVRTIVRTASPTGQQSYNQQRNSDGSTVGRSSSSSYFNRNSSSTPTYSSPSSSSSGSSSSGSSSSQRNAIGR